MTGSVEYPHGKASKPRDLVHYINDYKMEEVADLLWIGGIAAKHATSEWLELWNHIRAACVHYLYGFHASEYDMRTGHNHHYGFAECIEEAVKMGLVLVLLLTVMHNRLMYREQE